MDGDVSRRIADGFLTITTAAWHAHHGGGAALVKYVRGLDPELLAAGFVSAALALSSPSQAETVLASAIHSGLGEIRDDIALGYLDLSLREPGEGP